MSEVMKGIRIQKVVVNMGVGEAGEELKKAQKIMEIITSEKPIQTKCKVKAPTWDIRPGLPIGLKVTLRKEKAKEFLNRALSAKEKRIFAKSFDKEGNFGFGIKEYIDMPGAKYDPKLGIRGFDVLVCLSKPGHRIKDRKIRSRKIPLQHRVSKDEAINFVKESFGVEVE